MSTYSKLDPQDRKRIFDALGGKKLNKARRDTFCALWYLDKEILIRGDRALCMWKKTQLLRDGGYSSSQLTIKPVK